MAHHHGHGDDPHRHGVTAAQAASSAFVIGIALNLLYVAAEAAAGLMTGSLALLTDAGHNLSDVASLALSLLAFRLARIKPSKTFTYGFKKSTILAALANAVILLVAVGILGFEAVQRLQHPAPLKGGVVAAVAGLGIAVNGISALLFFRSRSELNARSAYLHLLADALVSAGVVVAGTVISFTGWYWLDPLVSLFVLLVILGGTWRLLTDSLRLSLDAVPRGVDAAAAVAAMEGAAGVQRVHHVHIWAMSTTENALTAHLVTDPSLSLGQRLQVIRAIRHELLHHNIQHATIELEES